MLLLWLGFAMVGLCFGFGVFTGTQIISCLHGSRFYLQYPDACSSYNVSLLLPSLVLVVLLDNTSGFVCSKL